MRAKEAGEDGWGAAVAAEAVAGELGPIPTTSWMTCCLNIIEKKGKENGNGKVINSILVLVQDNNS